MTPTTCDCAGCTLACCTRRNAEIADQLRAAKVQVLRDAAEFFKSNTWHNVDAKLRRMAEEIATSPEPIVQVTTI